MKFHYAGKYDGDETKLPQREHPAGASAFKEPDMKRLAVIANIGAIASMIVLGIPFILRGRQYITSHESLLLGVMLSWLTLIPHEFLHALCFREDVYMYNALKQGMLFVVGSEDMSKGRFIFMSLLPNLVFGIIPYIVFMIFPQYTNIGFWGLLSIGMGFGDYINVFNALTQMPASAKTYLSGTHSFWYIPEQ